MIRPDLRTLLRGRAELLVHVGVTLLGLWLAFLGGWFFALVGGGVILVGVSLTIGALRHLPFRRPIAGPGVVELVEGAVRYYGATEPGGEIALRDLVEIRLLRLDGRDHWRLRTRDGQALLVPVDARGADQLADAFAQLPGLDLGHVSAALSQKGGPSLRIVWTAKPG